MNSSKRFLVAASLLSCALFSLSAQAQLPFNVTLGFDPTLGGGAGAWTSGDIVIPGGAAIGSTPLELDLTLSQDLTLNSTGTGYNYSFGMGGFDPLVATGGDAFTFSIELLENGTLVTPDFATDIANPFTFGFDETNPFGFAVDNLSVSTSTTALANSLTFNQIDILVSNSNPGGEAVTDFSVWLGVNRDISTVPDTSNTLPLLSLGLLAMLGFGTRKVNAPDSQF